MAGYSWYTPFWDTGLVSVFPLASGPSAGQATGALTLVSPELDYGTVLQERSIRVTRVVGQFNVRGDVDFTTVGDGGDLFVIAARVYVVSADENDLALNRDLHSVTDADTDWMWDSRWMVRKDEWAVSGRKAVGLWGTNHSTTSMNPTFQNGRPGHFDIRVDRVVEEGQAMIFKVAIKCFERNGDEVDITQGNSWLDLWCRMLVKER